MTDLAFAAQTFGIYSGLLYGTPLAWRVARRSRARQDTNRHHRLLADGRWPPVDGVEHFFLVALISDHRRGRRSDRQHGGAGRASLCARRRPPHPRIRRLSDHAQHGRAAAPLVIGTLGEKAGWHYGFSAAGDRHADRPCDLFVGADDISRPTLSLLAAIERSSHRPSGAGSPAILSLLGAVHALFRRRAQAYGIMYVWADTAVNRDVLGFEVPVTWIGVVDGLLTIVGVDASRPGVDMAIPTRTRTTRLRQDRTWLRRHRRSLSLHRGKRHSAARPGAACGLDFSSSSTSATAG